MSVTPVAVANHMLLSRPVCGVHHLSQWRLTLQWMASSCLSPTPMAVVFLMFVLKWRTVDSRGNQRVKTLILVCVVTNAREELVKEVAKLCNFTPWTRFYLEKPVTEVVKKFPALCSLSWYQETVCSWLNSVQIFAPFLFNTGWPRR
jgi:hypothetical protein